MFNPFSLLKALDEKEVRPYWFATGTPTFLAEKIKQTGFDIRRFANKTLFASEAMLTDYRADTPDIVPLLYQTGYLTIVDYDARKQRYTLGFPNDEVEYGFLESLVPVYTPEAAAGSGKDIFTLDDCIEHGDADIMILLDGASMILMKTAVQIAR